MAGSFDVFFSYSTIDHAAVTRVARALHERGIRVFLDRWYLAAGQPWPQALERALASCGAVAVFLGAEGFGPWQQRERDLALDRQGHDPGFPVIPVLLSPADPALGFLRLNTWVDLSAGTEDEVAIEILAAAIRRQPPGPLALQQIAAVRAEVCPYRGLRPFREEDEPFFFGRGTSNETLVATLARQPFVAVVGASGSGKSSVVRAGLIPRLRRGEGGFVWDVVTLTPTDRPLASLTAALLPSLEPNLSEGDRLLEVNKLAAHLTEGSVALRDITGRILEKQQGTDRLLLFVDQWEELYTVCPDEQTRRAFATHLLEATAAGSVKVVLTMRGDFFGRALADRALSDQLRNAVVTIGPMTRGELTETIVKPAEAVGLTFEGSLAETIADDVGEEPGNLPLLEFLLEALWKARRGGLLQYDAYHRLGRVPGAIAHRADEVFERELTESEKLAAQRLLIRMVRPGEGAEDTRQRADMPEADPVAEATVRKLTDARLVVTERDVATGRKTVEVAHEALIRGWQRLRGWVDQDREFLRTRERIASEAKLWEHEGRSPDRLLPPGRPLVEGEDLLATRRIDLEENLVEYILASSAAENFRKEVALALQRRQLVRARSSAAAMLLLAVIAASFAYWWATEREVALKNLDLAQRNEWRALSALANIEAEKGSPATAVRVALSILPMSVSVPGRPYAREAEGALLRAEQQLREVTRFVIHDAVVSSVAFSPDGRTIVTGSGDKTARLWEVASGLEIAVLRGHEDAVLSVAFSPDGHTVVTGSGDRTARLWDVASGLEIAVLRGHEDAVSSVAFSPDGRIVVTGSGDKTARLWEVASSREIAILRGHESDVLSVAFSPDGRTVVTGSGDKTARLWEAASGREIAILRGHEDAVSSVAFSPAGHTVVTGSGDKTARLWEAASGREIAAFRGHESDVLSVAFSPDGRTVVTGSRDKTARLWEVASAHEIAAFRGHESDVLSVAFSPDGRTVVTGSRDKTARLWEVASNRDIAVLRGHESDVLSVAFSPDGRTVVTGSRDKTARLWEVASGREIAALRGHENAVLSVAFSPDGRTVATGSFDKTARLWEVASGREVAVLRGHENAVWSVAFSPDGSTVATGSLDKTARLWEVASGREIAVLRGHESDVLSVAFSPDGRTVVTGSLDKTARLWEVVSAQEVAVLRGHEDAVSSVAFSPDGHTIVTGSLDKTARLWEVVAGRDVASLPDFVVSIEGQVRSVGQRPVQNEPRGCRIVGRVQP